MNTWKSSLFTSCEFGESVATAEAFLSDSVLRASVMETKLPVIAGTISTTIFALGTLPMLAKAFDSKSLASYSFGNLLLINVGNIIYSVYVFNLPPGPIWVLHSFYILTSAVMLVWYIRYEGWPASHGRQLTRRRRGRCGNCLALPNDEQGPALQENKHGYPNHAQTHEQLEEDAPTRTLDACAATSLPG
jgi:uncharacterized protein with PQ loop repeat